MTRSDAIRCTLTSSSRTCSCSRTSATRTRTVHDLVTPRPSEGPSDGPTVVLTFDDGLLDFASEVLPRLRRYGFTATLYVPTAYVGATSRWLRREGEHEGQCSDGDELCRHRRCGYRARAHSHTHPQLDLSRQATLDNKARELPRELFAGAASASLVSTFSYRFGYYAGSVTGPASGMPRRAPSAICARPNLAERICAAAPHRDRRDRTSGAGCAARHAAERPSAR